MAQMIRPAEFDHHLNERFEVDGGEREWTDIHWQHGITILFSVDEFGFHPIDVTKIVDELK